jgi:hypothetical protein
MECRIRSSFSLGLLQLKIPIFRLELSLQMAQSGPKVYWAPDPQHNTADCDCILFRSLKILPLHFITLNITHKRTKSHSWTQLYPSFSTHNAIENAEYSTYKLFCLLIVLLEMYRWERTFICGFWRRAWAGDNGSIPLFVRSVATFKMAGPLASRIEENIKIRVYYVRPKLRRAKDT